MELKSEYEKVMKVVAGDHTLALNNLVLAHFSHPHFHCCLIAGRDFIHWEFRLRVTVKASIKVL